MEQNPAQQALQQSQQPQPAQDDLSATLLNKRKQLLAQYENAAPSPATISQALASMKPSSRDKIVEVGNALNTNNYSGLCLKYVDDKTGNKDRSPTAFADFQKNAAAGNVNTDGVPPKGARIYFAPTEDNPAGHVMLSNGDGSGTGATTNQGIKTFKIADWEKFASQQYIGWAK